MSKRESRAQADELLEDKLFAIVEATVMEGAGTNTWTRGFNAWMPANKLQLHNHYFAATHEFIEILNTGQTYRAMEFYYSPDEY